MTRKRRRNHHQQQQQQQRDSRACYKRGWDCNECKVFVHFHSPRPIMAAVHRYMCCLHENKHLNTECRSAAKAYFQCRMDHGLMDKDEWDRLGYGDK